MARTCPEVLRLPERERWREKQRYGESRRAARSILIEFLPLRRLFTVHRLAWRRGGREGISITLYPVASSLIYHRTSPSTDTPHIALLLLVSDIAPTFSHKNSLLPGVGEGGMRAWWSLIDWWRRRSVVKLVRLNKSIKMSRERTSFRNDLALASVEMWTVFVKGGPSSPIMSHMTCRWWALFETHVTN